jgi:dTDP-4-amino-4,6-dideoxygalactose transaminase
MIPLCDVARQYLALKEEIDVAVLNAVAGGRYILGPSVAQFEQDVASFQQCGYAIGVGSGTDALYLSLRALGIGLGDEVITTPFTFVATSAAICLTGANPVFVDIDPYTYNIDPTQIEAAITRRTKAILPVHLYGQPCDMQPILDVARRRDLVIVEDCAQAIGAIYQGRKVGTLGAVGCFSFFPSKNLGCMGDGGMVVTDSPQLADRVEMLRRHGGKIKYHHTELGVNSRLDEIQAAALRVKLPHLDGWNARRREIAYRYNELLRDVSDLVRPHEPCPAGPHVPTCASATDDGQLKAVYHQYTIQLDDRDDVAESLRDAGIQSFPYYPVPLHLQQIHANLGYGPGDFPVAESLANRCLSLPIYPELSIEQQEQVVTQLRMVLARRRFAQARGACLPEMPAVSVVPRRNRVFCERTYRLLLREFQEAGYEFVEFGAAASLVGRRKPFVLLRHDIDMDLQRAARMAAIEAQMGIRASYFFLLRTEHYNVLSKDGSDCVNAILRLGHHLGLHFDCAAYPEAAAPDQIATHIHREASVLGSWFGREISVVSFHRPSPQVLQGSPALSVPLLHTYMKQFVEEIHYCSDSRGAFRYGYPTDSSAFRSTQPMQLLIHPIWWGESHSSPFVELKSLAQRRHDAFCRSLDENCSVIQQARSDRAA